MSGSAFLATREVGEPSIGGIGQTVWWSWTAPGNGTVQLNSLGRAAGSSERIGVFTIKNPIQPLAVTNLNPGIIGTNAVQFTTIANTVYYIAVDPSSQAGVGFVVLNLASSPANDNIANAVSLGNGTTFSVVGDTTGATRELNEPSPANQPGFTVWYTWSAPFTTNIRLNTKGSLINQPFLNVFTSTAVAPNPTTVATLNPVVSGNSTVQFSTATGTVYYIAVDSNRGGATANDPGQFVLTLAAAPANDLFNAAIDLTGQQAFTVTADNTGATSENAEVVPPPGIGASVWWKWTASTNRKVRLDTSGSAINTTLNVFTGSAVNALSSVTPITSNGNIFTFNATQGTQYFIDVDGNSSTQLGTILLNLLTPPPNDDFANSIAVSGATFQISGTNLGATLEPTEPGTTGIGSTVWYTWTAPGASIAVFTTAGSTNFNGVLSVYTGGTLSSLARVTSGTQRVFFTATPGAVYRIRVDSATGSNPGNFVLSLVPTPPNDNFANATVVTGATFDTSGYNIGATTEPGEPPVGSGATVWWKWVAPVNEHLSLSTAGSALNAANPFKPIIKVFVGPAVNTLAAVTNLASDNSSFTFDAVAGTTYNIAVDSSTTVQGNIALTARTAPPNDNFAASIALSGPAVNVQSNNFAATKEPGEPNHNGNPGGQSVWYNWTAPATGQVQVTVTVNNKIFNPVLGIYTGGAVSALTTVASGAGQANFTATAGTLYQIAVDGDGTGIFNLNVAQAPANDNFANAQAINGYTTVTGSNVNATKEPGEPAHASQAGGTSVWFSFVAPDTRLVEITTSGSNFATILAVYTGTSVSALTAVASNVQSAPRSIFSTAQFNATAGTTYFIAVDGRGGAAGNIVLTTRRATVTITSALTILTTPQVAGQSVTFFVAADAPATFTWDFGDGLKETTTTGTISHTYAAAGPYNVTVTATLDNGFTQSSTATANVLAFANLGVSKVTIGLDFIKNKDSIGASGFLAIPPGGNSGPATIIVGGVTQSFTLSNGAFKNSSATVKITSPRSNGTSKLTFKFAGQFQAALAPIGMTKDIASGKPIQVPVQLILNNTSYQFTVTLFYTSTGKKGTAK